MTNAPSDIDFWNSLSGGAAEARHSIGLIETSVADDTLSWLSAPDPEGLRSYLVVDPNIRMGTTGVFDLDSVDVPAQCLFDGRAAEENLEVAPHLVDVTVGDPDIAPLFNRDFLSRHWGRSSGILLRSRGTFDEVRKHLRKFTKLRREPDDRWVFFRFWDPRIASVYFRTIHGSELRARQWFGDGLIESYVVEEDAGTRIAVFRSSLAEVTTNAPPGPVVLTDWELEPFRRTAFTRDLETMAAALKADFPAELKSYSQETVVSLIRPVVLTAIEHGFRRKEHLHVIAAWSLFFGAGFVEKDAAGVLARIWSSHAAETTRFAAMKARMRELGSRGAAA